MHLLEKVNKSFPSCISVAARSSPLSRIQVIEVLQELQNHYPNINFDSLFLETKGDKDKQTSLMQLENTDFFTHEIDELQLNGGCRISIHSAKDLPKPLKKGLKIVAITSGVDPSNSLVFRNGQNLETLPLGAKVGTSSMSRQESVRALREDLCCVDIRGNIGERLLLLEQGIVDALVIAEAALIRLGLTNLSRMNLPGPISEYQGQLAVIAREDDVDMCDLFRCIDTRVKLHKKSVYLGLERPKNLEHATHCPVIQIIPFEDSNPQIQHAIAEWDLFTHVILTSKNSVRCLFNILNRHACHFTHKKYIVIGKQTAACLREFGIEAHAIAQDETSEGLVEELKKQDLSNAYVLWPHSSLSRTVITDYLVQGNIAYFDLALYSTQTNLHAPKLSMNECKELIFTSPSTVDAFEELFDKIPWDKDILAIGSTTYNYLQDKQLQSFLL